jgi:hypothetical protein
MDGVIKEAGVGDSLIADKCAPYGHPKFLFLLVLGGTQRDHAQKQQAGRKKSAHLSSNAKRTH